MSNIRRRRVERLFHEVAELAPDERRAYLDAHDGGDGEVRAEVDSLLAHYDDGVVTALNGTEVLDQADEGLVGERIGPYRLLQLIGEGGFGSVYRAEQEEPVRRQVALKIIKLGMDTKQVIARFEAERQALAMMDHPHIARVLDAGATDSGRPYFVMELVRGIPITEYCDSQSLPPRQRLELFTQVCRAVQHAHQKGIIHRDLKPSNVLVSGQDGQLVPKIIDFGIAKATSARLTELTLFTEFRQFIGTPQYMSPEQAEISGLDIDTRTDVYSLGVLLYELLTGTTPFDARELRVAAFGDLQRIICEKDPQTPSQRLSTLGESLAHVAASRQTEPRTLSRLVRGDLDWIVMKALEKDRTRRYETAAGLADDVQRHLNNEPVQAGPPGAAYRLRKFVRRHQGAVVTSSLVILALLSGLAVATSGFVQARRERDAAAAEAARAQAVSRFLQDTLACADPMQSRQLSAFAPDQPVTFAPTGGLERDASVAEMARLAGTKVEQAFAGKPELEAAARETIGMTLRGLGRFADAHVHLEASLDIRRRELGADHPDTLRSSLALGSLLMETGRGCEAEPLVRTAFGGLRRVYGDEHPKTMSCASILASLMADRGAYSEAEILFSETLERQRRILGSEHRDTLFTMWHCSVSYLTQWKLTEGQELAHEVYEISRRTLPPDDYLNILSKPLMGWWHLRQYRYDRAEAVFRPGLEQCRRILGEEHPFTYVTMSGLAMSLQGRDVQDEKEQLQRAALAGLRATRGPLHTHTISTTQDFARWLDLRGRFEEAEELYRALLCDATEAFGADHRRVLSYQAILAGFLERVGKLDESLAIRQTRLEAYQRRAGEDAPALISESDVMARALLRAGRVDPAREVTQKLLASLKKNAECRSDDAAAVNNHAWVLLICVPTDLRDPETALPVAERAVELSERKEPAILDTLALAYHETGDNDRAVEIQKQSLELLPPPMAADLNYGAHLVRFLLEQGDTAAADRYVAKSVAMYRAALGDDNPLLAAQFEKSGVILTRAGHYTMAEALLIEALELSHELLGEEHERVASCLSSLAELYARQGRPPSAADALRAAIEMRRRLLGDDHRLVAMNLHSLGKILTRAGDAAGALPVLRESFEIYQQLAAEDVPAALKVRRSLAAALVALGRLEEAAPLAEAALAAFNTTYGESHLSTARAMQTYGWLRVEQGRAGEAEPILRGCLAAFDRLDLDESDRCLASHARGTLGYCLLRQERFAEAEPLLLTCYEEIHAARGEVCPAARAVAERLITLYEAWGKPERANPWRAKLALLPRK